jgi:hypothetical protein
MAMHTFTDLEMRLTFVANGAGDDRVGSSRWMLGVTVGTADFSGVPASIGGDDLNLVSMTLLTIPNLQFRRLSG